MIRPGDTVRIPADGSAGLVTAVVPMGSRRMYKVKIGLRERHLFDRKVEFVNGPIEVGDRVTIHCNGVLLFEGRTGLVINKSLNGGVCDVRLDSGYEFGSWTDELVRIEEAR